MTLRNLDLGSRGASEGSKKYLYLQTEKRDTAVRAFMVFIGFFAWSASVYALDFTTKSNEAIIGKHPDLDVYFSSVLEEVDFVVVTLVLNNKQITARINYKEETFKMKSIWLKNDSPAKITESDIEIINALVNDLDVDLSRVSDALVSILNLLSSYPPDEFINIDTRKKKKGGVTPQAWRSICEEIGNERPGVYVIEKKWIDKGFRCGTNARVVVLSNGDNRCIESGELGPCDPQNARECLGRCGRGCLSDLPNNPAGVQRYTQECFNHDLCRRATGTSRKPCFDELEAAVDGFLLAQDCAAIAGEWTVTMTGTTCVDSSTCGDISFERVFRFIQIPGNPFSIGTARLSDGRLSSYTVRRRTGSNNISGQWQVPNYMGEQCEFKPDGYARGSFTGQNTCGAMHMTFDGVWRWYNPNSCTSTGKHPFFGEIEAIEGTQPSSLHSTVRQHLGGKATIVPSLP